MLRLLLLLIVFATIDDAIAKPEFKGRQTISGLPRRVMRVHTKYTAIKTTRPSITKQTD